MEAFLHQIFAGLANGGIYASVALAFAAYSTQWIALIGFLPTIYQQAGHAGWVVGVLTALVSAGNIVGNVGAGRLLHAGAAPARLMICGYLTMAAGSVVAFADLGQGQLVRFAAVLLFSVVGGLIPATLFALATRAGDFQTGAVSHPAP